MILDPTRLKVGDMVETAYGLRGRVSGRKASNVGIQWVNGEFKTQIYHIHSAHDRRILQRLILVYAMDNPYDLNEIS